MAACKKSLSKTAKKCKKREQLKKKGLQSKQLRLGKTNTRIINENVKQREVVNLKQCQVIKAIEILNEKQTCTLYKAKEAIRRSRKCKLPIHELQQNHNQVYHALTSMSYINVASHMRHCIITHDWENLTKLLILFFDAKKQNCIKLRNAFVNLFNNPHAIKYNFLDEFLQMYVCCQNEENKTNFVNRLLSFNTEELPERDITVKSIFTEED